MAGLALIGKVVPEEVLLDGVLLVAAVWLALASAIMLYDGYDAIAMKLIRMR